MSPDPRTRDRAIAARRGKRFVCPPGGCVLARMLDAGRAQVGTPCLVEQIADGASDDSLALFSLDALREELEEAYGHRPALTHRRGRSSSGARDLMALAPRPRAAGRGPADADSGWRSGCSRRWAAVGWAAFALVDAGLLLRLLAEPQADAGLGEPAWRAVLGVAAVLPALGAVAFAASIWPRVRGAMTAEQAAEMRAARGVPRRCG